MGPLIFVLSLGKATLRFLLSPFCDLILPDAEWRNYSYMAVEKKLKENALKREIRECVRTVSFL